VVRSQWSVVSGPWSVVRGQWTVVRTLCSKPYKVHYGPLTTDKKLILITESVLLLAQATGGWCLGVIYSMRHGIQSPQKCID